MEKISEFSLENGIKCVKIEGIPRLNIFKTFDCGQSFRFDPVSLFGNKYEFGGVAFDRYVVFAQNNESEIIIYGSNKDEYEKIWKSYLALDVDYDKIDEEIKAQVSSPDMHSAILHSQGIRILRQDMWESVCSFIISQNNNIPRIKKIISALCKKYGKKLYFGKEEHYSFPSAKALMEAGTDAIFELKTGFRARYIYDASCKVATGEIDLVKIYNEPDFDKALSTLTTVKGIGTKVGSCALLFGFNKTEAFPIDVWIKRALEKYFPDGIDLKRLGKSAGIAQQYLFYYEKYIQNP
ncbi:MAG: DNA-3-methyladenine glycosylase 2 family protein [Clostridia bacterium]|nr:DNA-3-methyladenine glycosylase 2 family protein [Clostridia bacterium]